jgi:hypothetical protein
MDAILTDVNTATTTSTPRRSDQMLDLYASGTFAIDATDPRNHFNEMALHEARIATEYRNDAVAAPRSGGFLERVRAAVTGNQVRNTPEPCPCPA